MRDSDVMLTLVGEIIHGDPECSSWGILLTKRHGKGTVQARFAKHLTQYDHPLTFKLNKMETKEEKALVTFPPWISASSRIEIKSRITNSLSLAK
jgi:hypothetical protein